MLINANIPRKSNIARVRGIKEAAAELKKADPNTPIKEKTLRRLVLTGSIPCIKIGVRYYINMDVLNKYLTGGIKAEEKPPEYGKIRQVKP